MSDELLFSVVDRFELLIELKVQYGIAVDNIVIKEPTRYSFMYFNYYNTTFCIDCKLTVVVQEGYKQYDTVASKSLHDIINKIDKNDIFCD